MTSNLEACPGRTRTSISLLIFCQNFYVYSFLASGDFCCLLITFANSLDPDQEQQNDGPDLDPKPETLIVFKKVIFEKVNLKKSADDKIIQRAKSQS